MKEYTREEILNMGLDGKEITEDLVLRGFELGFYKAIELLKQSNIKTKDDASSKGYQVAFYNDYNLRNVMKDILKDNYYSGWMDCFEWIDQATGK